MWRRTVAVKSSGSTAAAAKAFFSSGGGRRSQNAALLRSSRKTTKRTATAANNNDNVNYRLRESDSSGGAAAASIASMWGSNSNTNDDNDNNEHQLRFFDQVDAHMRAKSGLPLLSNNSSNNNSNTLDTLFDSLENDESNAATQQQQQQQQSPPSRSILSSPITGERRSIFDTFPIPTTTTAAAVPQSHTEFIQIIEGLLENDPKNKLIGLSPSSKEWLFRTEPLIPYQLPTLDATVNEGRVVVADDSNAATTFREEIEQQRVAFLTALSSTHDEQHKLLLSILIKVGRMCAKQATALPLAVAWEKVKEAGIILDKDALSNYLHVASAYGRVPNSNASMLTLLQPQSEEEQEQVDVAAEVAAFHDNLYSPSEQSLTVRVKAMVRTGNAKAAESLLEENSHLENLRLRTYQPILRLYLDQGDINSGLKLFKHMRDIPSVIMEAETYIQIIAAMAENGYFHPNNTTTPVIDDTIGFYPTSGPALMDTLIAALAEDVIEITPALAKRLHTAMVKAFKDDDGLGSNLQELHPLAPLLLDNTNDDDDTQKVLASRVEIDTTTGQCPKTGALLRLIQLDGPQRQQLKASLLELAVKEHERFTKNHRGRSPKVSPRKQLDLFSKFMDKRKGKPYTAIVDGANIAYYLQNFDGGKFNFHQLQFMVDALEQNNETPLVVLPNKYTRSHFKISRGYHSVKQTVSDAEFDILNRLNDQGKLYVTPQNCLDDHFWMLASISDQKESRQGASLEVLPDDAQGRWPGTRPMLVSNDQMRDHKLGLIEPRLFRRWYSSHIVNFNFTGFVGDSCVDKDISFSPADFFSREIQANSSDDDGSTVWHFPVSDWKDNERFCLRIPKV